MARAPKRQPAGPVKINRGNALGAKVIKYLPLRPDFQRSTDHDIITLNGTGKYVSESFGHSLQGFAAGGGASVPLDLSAYSSITLAFSFFKASYLSDDQLLFEFTPNYNNLDGTFIVDPNSSDGGFDVGCHDVAYSAYQLTRPTAGVWHRCHVVFDLSVNQATVAVYIDGVAQSLTVPVSVGHVGSANKFQNSTLYLHSRNNASLFSDSKLADLTIYRGALSADEVAAELANPYQILQPQRSLMLPTALAGGTDTPVNPGVGAIVITGFAPTVAQSNNQAVAPAVGAIVFTGFAPTVAQTANQAVAPGAGGITFTGFAPTVTQAAPSPNITPGAGVLTFTGFAPTVTQTGGDSPAAANVDRKLQGGIPASKSPFNTPRAAAQRQRQRQEERAVIEAALALITCEVLDV